jgi:hypothetical protein
VEKQSDAHRLLAMPKETLFTEWIVKYDFHTHFKSEHAKKCAFSYWRRYLQRVVDSAVGEEITY